MVGEEGSALDPRCRIGKITPKDGSAVIFIPHMAERRRIATAFELLAKYMPEDELAGYFMVAWDINGTYSSGFWVDVESQIGPTMAPTFVADVLRRDLIEGGVWR